MTRSEEFRRIANGIWPFLLNKIKELFAGDIAYIKATAQEALSGLEDKLDCDLDNLSVLVPVVKGGTGQSAVLSQEAVTYNTSVASAHSIAVRRFLYLGMCFIRASFKVTGTAVAANTWVTFATVDSSIAPLSRTALAISAIGGNQAMITPDGLLQVAFSTAQTASQTRNVYVSGWWIVH